VTHDPHKYAKPERERRFLLSATTLPPLQQRARAHRDLYLTGTRLRLRVMTEHPSGAVLYKLTQKIQPPGSITAGSRRNTSRRPSTRCSPACRARRS
jgi:hypothetical protein